MGTLDVAKRIYKALGERDKNALLTLLHPDFTGEVSAGMPLGVGGPVAGPEAMLRVWSTIGRRFAVRPDPEEFTATDDDRVFVVGHYRGQKPDGGAIDAAFVHILQIEGGKVRSLRQITDTNRWPAA